MNEPNFFTTPADFCEWLQANHQVETALWVGFHKKSSGQPSITWPESVDQALCFGWIDGIRKRLDASRYMIRFTPRKPTSAWSAVNIARVADLSLQGRMRPAGRKAFASRSEAKSAIYSYEQRGKAVLDKSSEQLFRSHAKAWQFFLAQAPSYRALAVWRIISAKRDETRQKRLARLIEVSLEGRRLE